MSEFQKYQLKKQERKREKKQQAKEKKKLANQQSRMTEAEVIEQTKQEKRR